jgi:alpha-glucosidase
MLHIYRPQNEEHGKGLLFSDAGDGYGESRLDRFKLTQDNQNSYQLAWTAQGEYPFPYEKVIVKLHGFEGKPLIGVHVNVPQLENLIEIALA